MVRHPEVRRAVTMAGVGGFTWFAFTLGLASLGAETSRPGLLVAEDERMGAHRAEVR